MDTKKYELLDVATMWFKTARGADLIGDDGKTPAGVVFHSPGTSEGVKADHVAQRGASARMFRHMRNDIRANDAADALREQVAKLTGYTKEFVNCSVEPLQFWGNPKLPHLRKQAEEFIGDPGNFEPGSSTN